jgi:hypothetical protein
MSGVSSQGIGNKEFPDPRGLLIILFRFLMHRMRPASPAEFLPFKPFGGLFLVLRCRVIAFFAIRTLQRNDVSHDTRSLEPDRKLNELTIQVPDTCLATAPKR